MFICGVTIDTLMQAFRYITEKKNYLDQIGHISYYLHIALQWLK